VEHAIQHNLHTVLNFCIATAPTAPTARFPLILVIGVTSVFDWSEARVNSMNLEETWASDPAISMAGLETDAAKLDRLLQRAQEFLLPYPQACAVLLISDTERFKTPLIFVDFARMLPELRSLLADDAAAARKSCGCVRKECCNSDGSRQPTCSLTPSTSSRIFNSSWTPCSKRTMSTSCRWLRKPISSKVTLPSDWPGRVKKDLSWPRSLRSATCWVSSCSRC